MKWGTGEVCHKATRAMAMAGLLVAASLLVFAQPNRAEAGIHYQITVVNNTDEPVSFSLDGRVINTVGARSSLKFQSVGDGDEDDTVLHASNTDESTVWDEIVTGNVDKATWNLFPGGRTTLIKGQ